MTEEAGKVSSTINYSYDAQGNRVQTEVDGKITRYVVDNNASLPQVIAELDAQNQVKVAYLHGDDLIGQFRGNEIRYYHYDGLGSTRLLTDENAKVTDSYTYEAFGEILQQTGETENHYLYTGEQLDPETGNYYLRTRFYSPDSGRFWSMDSFDGWAEEPVTLHKYLYANGDPVNFTDPSGYFSLGEFGAAHNGQVILMMQRTNKALDLLEFIFDPAGALADRAMGAAVIFAGLGKRAAILARPLVCKKNSFPLGTLVHTKQGLIPIEDIQIGELVLSYDEETSQTQFHEVTHLIEGEQEYQIVTLTLTNGEILQATADHPFYIQGKGWNPAASLKIGQVLQLYNGTTIVIEEVSTSQYTEKVYNLSVANAHTFYIGESGVLVHNVGRRCNLGELQYAYERNKRIFDQKVLDYFHGNEVNDQQRKKRKVAGSLFLPSAFFGGTYSEFAVSGREDMPRVPHRELQHYLNQAWLTYGENAWGVKHPVGCCAEFKATDKLLKKLDRSEYSTTYHTKLPYIMISTAYYYDKNKKRKRKKRCKYCYNLDVYVFPQTKYKLQQEEEYW